MSEEEIKAKLAELKRQRAELAKQDKELRDQQKKVEQGFKAAQALLRSVSSGGLGLKEFAELFQT